MRASALLPLLIACGGDERADPYADLAFPPAGPGEAPDPSTWGPFPVGVITLWFTDGENTLPDGSAREFPVEVWYPAASDEGDLRDYEVAQFVPDARLEEEGIDPAGLPILTSNSLDAPAADTSHGDFPLVIFSHGNGGMRLQSLFLTEYLASHGYVVASPDHVGNTLADLLEPGAEAFSTTADSLAYRPDDVRAVVERLRGSDDIAPVSDGPWGMTGHSLGAWTAFRMLVEMDDIAVAVPQAPPDVDLALVGSSTTADELEMPILIQAGTEDQILDYEENAVASFESMRAPTRMATYYDAGHFTFSDLCVLDLGEVQELIFDSAGDVMQDGCGEENPAPELALPLLRFHAIGLINAVLRDSPESEALMLEGMGGEYDALFELAEAD